jgi:hypothetical protein
MLPSPFTDTAKGLTSAICSMLLRVLHRDHDEGLRLAERESTAVATATATGPSFNSEDNAPISFEELHELAMIGIQRLTVVCGLSISLVTIAWLGTVSPWDVTIDSSLSSSWETPLQPETPYEVMVLTPQLQPGAGVVAHPNLPTNHRCHRRQGKDR